MCRSMIVMKQFQCSQIRFSPLLIRSLMVLPLSAFGTAEDAAFMRKNPAELHTTAEKLRWYRLHARLSQRELSEQLGISRAVYRHYEDGRQSLYPKRQLIALAKLYGVKYTDLADGYTLFVHRGQSKQLARRRMALLIPQLAASAGATEDLKARDPIRWVSLMNTCTHQAEELVLQEVVYR